MNRLQTRTLARQRQEVARIAAAIKRHGYYVGPISAPARIRKTG